MYEDEQTAFKIKLISICVAFCLLLPYPKPAGLKPVSSREKQFYKWDENLLETGSFEVISDFSSIHPRSVVICLLKVSQRINTEKIQTQFHPTWESEFSSPQSALLHDIVQDSRTFLILKYLFKWGGGFRWLNTEKRHLEEKSSVLMGQSESLPLFSLSSWVPSPLHDWLVQWFWEGFWMLFFVR